MTRRVTDRGHYRQRSLQTHLVPDASLADEEQVLQVRVEQWTVDHGDSKTLLNDEAHCAVVRETDGRWRLLKLGAAAKHTHTLIHAATNAKYKIFVSYLAQGDIFSASRRLRQNPAPPVANQNCTSLWEETHTQRDMTEPQFSPL